MAPRSAYSSPALAQMSSCTIIVIVFSLIVASRWSERAVLVLLPPHRPCRLIVRPHRETDEHIAGLRRAPPAREPVERPTDANPAGVIGALRRPLPLLRLLEERAAHVSVS